MAGRRCTRPRPDQDLLGGPDDRKYRPGRLMPATQRGQAYRLAPGKWGLRYYDASGARRRKSPFGSKSAALAYYRDVIEPELRGEAPPAPDLTLAEFVPLFLERHAGTGVRPRTVSDLRKRLVYAT